MSPPAGDTPRKRQFDFTGRPRATMLDALRYTRFVAFMKRALPSGAAVIVLSVLAYLFVQRAPDKFTLGYTAMGRIENDLAMIKPRLTGTDDKGNPFTITADAAIPDPKNLKRAGLRNVAADIGIDGKRWVNAQAARGQVDMNAGTLALTGGLSVYSDDGYELHTPRADADLHAGTMQGPAVNGQGPMGTLRADNFHIDRNTRQLRLDGNVHMVLNSAKAATP